MLDKIQGRMPELARAERKVALFVLQNPRRIANMTLAELAQASAVSHPTVISFWRGLGYSDFQSFKLALGRAVAQQPRRFHSHWNNTPPLDEADIAPIELFDQLITMLLTSRRKLSEQCLTVVVQTLLSAHRVILLNTATAAELAALTARQWLRCGLTVIYSSEATTLAVLLSDAQPDDVVMLLSLEPDDAQLLSLVQALQQRQVPVLALVPGEGSLAQAASMTLPLPWPAELKPKQGQLRENLVHSVAQVICTILSYRLERSLQQINPPTPAASA